jgi:RNA polymerase sigma factor (TIGR02999 family)
MNPSPELTTLLQAVGAGDSDAAERLYLLAYGELKRLAKGALRRSGGGRGVTPTTLVHEAYMKIAQGAADGPGSSEHFYCLFARVMRQVLLDIVRQQGTVKHGAGQREVDLTDGIAEAARPIEDLLQIDAALTQLEQTDADLAQLVEWHFFAGLSFVEIAAARGVNERTVRRHWDMARALLLDAMPEMPHEAEAR